MATRKKGSHWVRWAWGSWAPQGAMALAVACDALYPLEGSRRGAVEDVGGPWGSSRPLSPGGPIPPSPWALPGMGDSGGGGGREQNEVGKAVRASALKASPEGPRPPQKAGERWRRLWHGGGRACSAGTRGMHKVPECACVRGAGPSVSCPRRGWSSGAEGQGRHGAGFPSACPASSAGPRSGAPAGMEEGLLPRAWPVPAAGEEACAIQ